MKVFFYLLGANPICLVVNPITVGNFAFLFNCSQMGWTSDVSNLKAYLLMRWKGSDALAVVMPNGFTCWISFDPVFSFIYF